MAEEIQTTEVAKNIVSSQFGSRTIQIHQFQCQNKFKQRNFKFYSILYQRSMSDCQRFSNPIFD